MLKIILKKNIKNLGDKYNIIKVKSGYALNYLIPKKYAVIATKSEIKINEEIINNKKKKTEKLIKKYKEYIKKINNINLEFNINYKKGVGKISKKKIKKELEKYNIYITNKNIILRKKIIKPGEYKIKIIFLNKLNTFLKIKLTLVDN
ncbi:MAG: 50S ribosomal protein L9 [Candidatus Shikimatogenerans bostrichidophilus]|nr:MAG: 50S ribosomal protein L9 [Candidatus Shikimatogenerans bostrichidophilus]